MLYISKYEAVLVTELKMDSIKPTNYLFDCDLGFSIHIATQNGNRFLKLTTR